MQSQNSLSHLPTCPVCSAQVETNSLQQHVNLCLDQNTQNISQSRIPSPPSSSNDDNDDNDDTDDSVKNITKLSQSSTNQPISIWLKQLQLQQYTNHFLNAGFYTLDDILNSSSSTSQIIQSCGINTIGARRRIQLQLNALNNHKREHSSNPSSSPQPNKKPRLWAIFQPGYRAPSDNLTTHTKSLSSTDNTNVTKRKPLHHHFSHRVPGTSFTVDSFRAIPNDQSSTHFFLTHFHSDHYIGLRKKVLQSNHRIFCSKVTARLVRSQLHIPAHYITEIPLATKFDVPDPLSKNSSNSAAGASIWAYDANHCPGAVILLYYIWKTKRWVLHTGDCRFDSAIFSKYPQLVDVINNNQLDYLHLDTTYCDPRYKFPAQKDILSQVVIAARNEDQRTRHRCLFFFGTYSIGKEKVFLEVANALDLKIYTTKRKREILQQLDLGSRLTNRLVDSPKNARVHVVSMRALSAIGLRQYANHNGLNQSFIGRGLAIVFRPTGWSFKQDTNQATKTNRQQDQAMVYDVAYSEHSSFDDLTQFVQWANPTRLIPTVNAWSEQQAEQLRTLLRHDNNKQFRPVQRTG